MTTRLTIALEHRFTRTPDGAVWTETAYARPYWDRYLAVFDVVRVVARAHTVPVPSPQAVRVDDARVSVASVPAYVGPLEYVRRRSEVNAVVGAAVSKGDAVILRAPGQIAGLLAGRVRQLGMPYGVEVVGDPYDVFAPGVVRHPLRPFLRWHFVRQLRLQTTEAAAVAYVTTQALQRRYPSRGTMYGISDVELPGNAFVDAPRIPHTRRPVRLSFVGSFAQLYKAPDTFLEAIAICRRQGHEIDAEMIGDGVHRASMQALAARLGVAQYVHFAGIVPAGSAVRARLDASDIFVIPSRTEGMPRALIEAMARGLPCIGSRVGGIPELLPEASLVVPGDATALAQAIGALAGDPARRAAESARNLAVAREFRDAILQERRTAFLNQVQSAAADQSCRWST